MKVKLCERCKVALKKIELKDVYQCPVCFTVTEYKEENE
jgi:DNA-directed RNA polymerase subunit RPC12/RpoP